MKHIILQVSTCPNQNSNTGRKTNLVEPWIPEKVNSSNSRVFGHVFQDGAWPGAWIVSSRCGGESISPRFWVVPCLCGWGPIPLSLSLTYIAAVKCRRDRWCVLALGSEKPGFTQRKKSTAHYRSHANCSMKVDALSKHETNRNYESGTLRRLLRHPWLHFPLIVHCCLLLAGSQFWTPPVEWCCVVLAFHEVAPPVYCHCNKMLGTILI